MEHKYTVTLEGANDKQERINNMRDRLAAKELDMKKLDIGINQHIEEVSASDIAILNSYFGNTSIITLYLYRSMIKLYL